MEPLPPIDELLLFRSAPLRRVLEILDRTASGIVFVVDGDHRLCGVCTDGDIRRGLLRSLSLESEVGEVMTHHPVALPVTAPRDAVLAELGDAIRVIPLLDAAGRPIDYASFPRYRRIPVLEPELRGNELTYVTECIKTGWISSKGRFVLEFEKAFAAYIDVPEAVSVSNGTTALHLALLALGIGPGDEVIVPDLTFAATANAVLHAGATPVLVDVRPDTWNIDPDAAAAAITSRTRAIMPVHLYGLPADMDGMRALAERHGLVVIEDAAEALGAFHHGRAAGGIGDAGCFSFFGNKLITTGEGGMVTFRDPAAAARARMLRDHGMAPDRRYWHEEVGYNYRMTNIQAALGVAQLERIDEFIGRKLEIAEMYRAGLQDIPGVTLPEIVPDLRNVYWVFSIILGEEIGISRDEVAIRLNSKGIETRPLFYPLHTMPPYRRYAGNRQFAASDRLSRCGLSLPSGVTMTPGEIAHVVDTLRGVLKEAVTTGGPDRGSPE
ncbi:aminotransferase class I/II-fold pyridoxal phosphate-dependent enzyme (plasmid) [Azospirillum sp. TSA2s]|uniref:aminotransferase class I/II-fold pyridoxal phosphate-dependent enzyme n=1 Tax=Azospirillum sp. TSA2s TaxID=709810 RepID=UPI0010A996FE|nr:aminotransferase class I/II-fold pyridoxal phosphate-dependent enzyme [Azospirillum sp. TSA2s]QCG93042.1 aminotransferase class I/II-fold pyridoxal phosphate-dependent enzyme [Azospirillum sp. TSA2s]